LREVKVSIKAHDAKAPIHIKAPEAKPNFFGVKGKTQEKAKSNIDTEAWFESDLPTEGAKAETKAKVESKSPAHQPSGKHPATTEWFDIDETPWVGDATASDAKKGHHFVIKAESKTKHVVASHAHADDITTKHADTSVDSHLKKAAESDSDVAEMLKFEKSAESEGGDTEDKGPEFDASSKLDDKGPEVDSMPDDVTSLQQTQKSVTNDDDVEDEAEESTHPEKDLSAAVAAAATALSPTNTLAAPDVDAKSTARVEPLGMYDDSWHDKPISLAHYDSMSHDGHALHEDDEHFQVPGHGAHDDHLPPLPSHERQDGSAHEPQDDHLPPLPKHLQGNLQDHSDYEDSESLLAMGDHEDFQYDENAHDKVHAYDDHSMDMGDMDDLTHDHYSGDDHDDFSDDSYESDNYDDEDTGL